MAMTALFLPYKSLFVSMFVTAVTFVALGGIALAIILVEVLSGGVKGAWRLTASGLATAQALYGALATRFSRKQAST
jgi:hypothetical protein